MFASRDLVLEVRLTRKQKDPVFVAAIHNPEEGLTT